jgi:drug/metabolite transporter (DMT)-like permease
MTARPAAFTRGSALAVLAALSFGVTTPVVARAGHGLGPFSTAALLYLGASGSAFALGRVGGATGSPLRRHHLVRLLWVAFFGAVLAPSAFAWGLQRSGATTGSLLLNLEAVFTVLLAWLVYREPIGRRVALALALMALVGVVLALDAAQTAAFSGLGALAIALATAAWALDNTLTRALAEQDPVQVVAAKGGLGAVATAVLALVAAEPLPGIRSAFVLCACGATGYGLSLRLYLLAQRRVGAARTGSIFALAPFLGATFAWILGDQVPGPLAFGAAALFAAGVWLHATERHAHRHVHPRVGHEHAHRHDDGHHDHVHDPPVRGEHTHPHQHESVEHEHDHAPDLHHHHQHD